MDRGTELEDLHRGRGIKDILACVCKMETLCGGCHIRILESDCGLEGHNGQTRIIANAAIFS